MEERDLEKYIPIESLTGDTSPSSDIGKKLYVIDKQRINRAVITLEVRNGIQLQCFHHVGNKAL